MRPASGEASASTASSGTTRRHEAGGERLRGRDRVPGEDDPAARAGPARSGSSAQAAGGITPSTISGWPNDGALARDDQVGGLHELEGAAEAAAADRGDQGHRERRASVLMVSRNSGIIVFQAGGRCSPTSAPAEKCLPPRPTSTHPQRRVLGERPERGPQLAEQRPGEDVERRIVQRHPRDAVLVVVATCPPLLMPVPFAMLSFSPLTPPLTSHVRLSPLTSASHLSRPPLSPLTPHLSPHHFRYPDHRPP